MKVARRATSIFNAHPNRTQCTTDHACYPNHGRCARYVLQKVGDHVQTGGGRVPKPYPSEPKPYPDQTPLALSCALMHASAQHCGISDQTLPPPPPAEAHANKHKEWEGGSLSRMPLQGNQYPGLTLCSSDLNFKLIY